MGEDDMAGVGDGIGIGMVRVGTSGFHDDKGIEGSRSGDIGRSSKTVSGAREVVGDKRAKGLGAGEPPRIMRCLGVGVRRRDGAAVPGVRRVDRGGGEG